MKVGIAADPDERIGTHVKNGYVELHRVDTGNARIARDAEAWTIAAWAELGGPVADAPLDGRTETVAASMVDVPTAIDFLNSFAAPLRPQPPTP